jgi:hypothetical protein
MIIEAVESVSAKSIRYLVNHLVSDGSDDLVIDHDCALRSAPEKALFLASGWVCSPIEPVMATKRPVSTRLGYSLMHNTIKSDRILRRRRLASRVVQVVIRGMTQRLPLSPARLPISSRLVLMSASCVEQ